MPLVSLAKVQKPSPEARKRGIVSLEGQLYETQLSDHDEDFQVKQTARYWEVFVNFLQCLCTEDGVLYSDSFQS